MTLKFLQENIINSKPFKSHNSFQFSCEIITQPFILFVNLEIFFFAFKLLHNKTENSSETYEENFRRQHLVLEYWKRLEFYSYKKYPSEFPFIM